MNTKHICKFCKRSFPCGRSLGGHIRSHLIHKNNSPSEEPDSSKPRYELRENPKKTYKDSNLLTSSSPSSWSTESENENRVRNSKGKSCFISHSSVSEPEEEDISGAMCLIMLSRDKMSDINTQFFRSSSYGYFQNGYDQNSQNKRNGSKIKEFEDEYTPNDQRNKYHESGLDEIESGLEIYKSNSKRSKFECTTCNKVFHSYQALGGHRASHKKMMGVKFYPKPESNDQDYPSPNYEYNQDQESQTKFGIGSSSTSTLPKKVVQKHECPICFRVFSSGQALGGHKRSHVLAANNSNNNYEINMVNNSSNSEIRDFLNLNISPIPRPRPGPETDTNTGTGTGIDTDPAEEGANTLVGLIKPYWWVEAPTIMSHF